MYIHIYIYIYIQLFIFIYIYTVCIYIYTHMYICINIRLDIQTWREIKKDLYIDIPAVRSGSDPMWHGGYTYMQTQTDIPIYR